MTNVMRATIEEGIGVVREWHRGDGAHLDRWAKTYLTKKGWRVLFNGLPAEGWDEEQIRALVAKAVGTGN